MLYLKHSWGFTPVHISIGVGRWLCNLAALVKGGFEHSNKLVIIPRLDNEIKRTAFHALYGQLHIGVCGKQHHLNIRCHALYLIYPVQAFISGIDVCIEVHVKQYDIGAELPNRTYNLIRRCQSPDRLKMQRQQHLQRLAYSCVVINNQYLSFLLFHT